jgi:predicted MFS family arabinose efflux permease
MFLLNGTVFASWVPHIPAVKARLALNDAQLGLLLLCIAAGSMASLAIAGWAVSRLGSRAVTVGAALGLALTLPLPLATASVTVTATTLVAFGAFNALLDVAMNAQAVEVQERYGRSIMSSFHGCFSLGGLCGAALGGGFIAAGVGDLRHPLAVAAAAVLCIGVASAALLRSPPTRAAREPVFVRPTGALLPLGLLALGALMVEGAMADWSALYLHDTLRATPQFAAAGFAVFSLAMALGRFGGDRLVDRYGPARLLRRSGLLAAAGLLIALTGSQAAALAGFGLLGLGMANAIPVLFTAAGRVQGAAPGRALAAVASAGYLGFLAGPPLIGFVAEAWTLTAALAGLAMLCAALAAWASSVAPPAAQRSGARAV